MSTVIEHHWERWIVIEVGSDSIRKKWLIPPVVKLFQQSFLNHSRYLRKVDPESRGHL
jgi:hypothetical protein